MSAVSAVNEKTGETMELPAETREDVVDSLLFIKSQAELLDNLKKQLNKIASEMIDADGPIEHKGHRLTSTLVQRKVYDPVILRQVFDEDQLALFSEYKKTAIDEYIAGHLEELGDDSTLLRSTMIEHGSPYSVVRLEKQQ